MAVPFTGGRKALFAHEEDALVDIERERIARMQENDKRLRELGLMEAKEDLAAAVRASQPARKAPQPRVPRTPRMVELEVRRSERTRGQPAPKYNEDALFGALQGTRSQRLPLPKAPKARREPGQTALSRWCGGWHPNMGWASSKASDEARAAAEERVEEIEAEGGVADVKDMTASQVSGGFWCQLNKGFAKTFNLGAKRPIQLRYDDEEWTVILLPRPGGAGLSGGWRTFAIDQVLFPGDKVLMQKEDEDHIRVELFRAYDYDPEFKARFLACQAAGDYDNLDKEGGEAGEGEERRETAAEAAAGTSKAGDEDAGQARMGGTGQLGDEGAGAAPRHQGEGDDAAVRGGGAGHEAAGVSSKASGSGRRSNAASKGGSRADTAQPQQAADRKLSGGARRGQTHTDSGAVGEGSGAARAADTRAGGGSKAEPRGAARKQAAADGTNTEKQSKRTQSQKRRQTGGEGEKPTTKRQRRLPPVDGDNEFFVSKVVDFVCDTDNVDWFKIRWMGYGPKDDTWQTADSLSAPPGSYAWDCKMPARFKLPATALDAAATGPDVEGRGMHTTHTGE